ncbi:DUF402 domain-containing protein [Arthrobacter sp. NPDC055138]
MTGRIPAQAQPGDMVVFRNWKYDGGAHWLVPGTYLGADSFGDWIFQPAGSLVARPGVAFYAASDAVQFLPREGNFVATFYDDAYPGDFRIYIDLATGIRVDPLLPAGWEVQVTDMDLDVIRTAAGRVYIDDEDEFAEHRVTMDYPAALAEQIQASCRALYGQVLAQAAPFDGTALTWLNKGRT